MPPRGESMISRVVRVLEAFKGAEDSLTASEIARQTGIPVPSAHRIVTELDELGVLDRHSTVRFLARREGLFPERRRWTNLFPDNGVQSGGGR